MKMIRLRVVVHARETEKKKLVPAKTRVEWASPQLQGG
jgi:hypothetical protein